MTNIHRQFLDDHICLLTFDRPNSTANIFDRATLEELENNLAFIATSEAKALVLATAKDGIFVAGADLFAIRKMSVAELDEFIALGQRVFARIAALPIPTVAAIHGVAVGGGCEVALACDWRIASDEPSTKIGLPETQLGIIPAWGGCTRLPRLISVPAALDIILPGKTLTARKALKAGLVDEVAPHHALLTAARKWLAKGKRPHALLHSAPVNAVVDAVLAPYLRRQTEKRTHGHYPAVRKALEVVLAGASDRHEEKSLTREREAIRELIADDTTRQLMNLFFLQERAKKLSHPQAPEAKPAPIQHTAVIGAGVMGAGIAQWLSARGLPVILRDVNAARVGAGMNTAAKLFAEGKKRGVFTERDARAGLERIAPAPVEVPLPHTDLVIEAAVEKMEIKKTIFQRLDELVREDCILATNTSALSITELAAATRHPERVIGIHFFNPVHRMQLVEVVLGKATAPEVAQRALRLVQRIGKSPVLVKDSPGFLVNRILLPYLVEAGTLFEQGIDANALDEAMLDFGMPMGPLRLMDEVGLDVAADVAQTLSAAFPDRMRVPAILPRMIADGALGKKTGRGFYLYSKDGQPSGPNPQYHHNGGHPAADPSTVARRLALLMVNESARCLEEQIATEAADIDFAMVMGTGWAPFRGGPLRYADHLGVARVADELQQLAQTAGAHFAPCARLTNATPFYEN